MNKRIITVVLAVLVLILGVVSAVAIKNSLSARNADVPVIIETGSPDAGSNGGTVAQNVYSEGPSSPEDSTASGTDKVDSRFKVVAVGDILLGRGVGTRLKDANRSFTYPFLEVADILKKGDVVFGNLEEPITARTRSLKGIKEGGKYVLKNDPEAVEGLIFAGFNLFSLANNHILDYYEEGLFDTMAVLDELGIAYSGAGKNIDEARKPAIIEKKGVRVGLLSYTDMAEVVYKGNPPLMFIAGKDKPGVAKRPIEFDDSIKSDIESVRDNVDILIVSLHWGVEDSFKVLPNQREYAHKLIDAGVDIVLGHHPHQFQGMEVYKNKPIFYSLGNFIFDQNDPENQESFIISMDFEDYELKRIEAVPVRTINKVQVVPQHGTNAKDLLERELNLCRELGTNFRIDKDTLVFDMEQAEVN